MFKKLIYSLSILGAITLQNCKSTDGDDSTPTPVTAPAVTLPSELKNIDGVMATIKTSTMVNSLPFVIGSAYAVFYKTQNPSTKLDAGSVKINTKVTTKTDDNIYFYTSSASEPNGLNLQGSVLWEVGGSTANGVPSFNDNDGTGSPNLPSVPGSLIMLGSQPKSIDWNTSTGSDSVILIITGPSATYKKVFPSSVTSHTVPAAEIIKLGAGQGTYQVINYKIQFRTHGGKTYAFLKQSIGLCNNVTISK